jgi:hypothetical protein
LKTLLIFLDKPLYRAVLLGLIVSVFYLQKCASSAGSDLLFESALIFLLQQDVLLLSGLKDLITPSSLHKCGWCTKNQFNKNQTLTKPMWPSSWLSWVWLANSIIIYIRPKDLHEKSCGCSPQYIFLNRKAEMHNEKLSDWIARVV